MRLPDEMSEEQHRAIVDCLRIFAARGRQLRLEREARERAAREMGAPPESLGRGTAGATDNANETNALTRVRMDATQQFIET